MYLRLPECDAIPEVENGNAVVPFVEGPILSGTIIQYTCDTGFINVFNRSLTCIDDGTWNDTVSCELGLFL